ncbi:hypothetical protein FLACOL_00230 [Flavobacterium columnare]|uniref:DUF4393 domain-containing protein n=1 Tax=Flavobacterium columnare TaxID=996 RepID=A0A2N9P7D3_9FLAO|nr:Abi-alpha family protein [Flavobacterium columnare]SPE76252.1 hypothetical protein FLACOL_00230 [Flavobacterium columnare]
MSIEKKEDTLNGIGIASEKAINFVEKLIAEPFMEMTGIFTDKIKLWRFKNQVSIIDKARKFLKEKGIEVPKTMPIKDLSTLLEYASFEENEIMQDNWAKLLANTVDPNNKFDSCYVFSQLLNQLSVDEYHILEYIFYKCFQMSDTDRPYFDKNTLSRLYQGNYQTLLLMLDNLLRLRLIEEEPPKLKDDSSLPYSYPKDEESPKNEIIVTERYRLSLFGVELIRQIRN